MAARRLPWRDEPSAEETELIGAAMESRLMLLHELGPTRFVVKGLGSGTSKAKVTIGGVQKCSLCAKKGKRAALCVHILFVMLKVLRVPRDNPLVWQLSLLSSEVDQILDGRFVRQQRLQQQRQAEQKRARLKRSKPAAPREGVMCPICQDEFDMPAEAGKVVHCRAACGNPVHVECMKAYVQHRVSSREKILCPLCRQEWRAQDVASLRRPRKLARNPVHRTVCSRCRSVARPEVYRCLFCRTALCTSCFRLPFHVEHPFVVSANNGTFWSPAPRHAPRPALPSNLVSELAGREITEADYELLLRLDEPARAPPLVDFLLDAVTDEDGTVLLPVCNHTMALDTLREQCQADFTRAKCADCSAPVFPGMRRPLRRNSASKPATRKLAQPPRRSASAFSLFGVALSASPSPTPLRRPARIPSRRHPRRRSTRRNSRPASSSVTLPPLFGRSVVS